MKKHEWHLKLFSMERKLLKITPESLSLANNQTLKLLIPHLSNNGF